MMTSKVVLTVACVVASAAVGFATGAYRASPIVRDTPARGPVDAPLTRAEIAEAVRSELLHMPTQVAAAVKAQLPAVQGQATPTPPSPEPPGRRERPAPVPHPEACARAETIIREAVNIGRWTDTDRLRVREELTQVSDEEWAEVGRQLAVAINSGAVKVETEGIPF